MKRLWRPRGGGRAISSIAIAKVTRFSSRAGRQCRLVAARCLEITRDITAQVIAEEALRRNERLAAMGKLAGIVAHEINNPLEAITNAFYLLRQHHSLDEEAKYYAQIAEQELARVSHITKQTLSFYRESQKSSFGLAFGAAG